MIVSYILCYSQPEPKEAKENTTGGALYFLNTTTHRQTMPRRIATLATCNLNQWALDFDGNLERIRRSIEQARAAGATYRVSFLEGSELFLLFRRSLALASEKRKRRAFSIFYLPLFKNAKVGPELELTGYGCEDHFLEPDTEDHAWRCLAELLCSGVANGGGGGGGDGNDADDGNADPECSLRRNNTSNSASSSTSSSPSILIDIGLVATHAGARYNVRVFCLEGRVLLVRPKSALADDGNYRESRYFRAWRPARGLETFALPRSFTETMMTMTRKRQGKKQQLRQLQETAPIGHAILALDDATLAAESCEELFTPCPPHVALALAGCEIVSNGSGSHHQLRKLDEQRLSLLREATRRCGGVYLYANQRGCDGGRLYYDGCACVLANGALVAQGAQFGLGDVEVVTADVDLDDVAAFRGGVASAQEQAASSFGGRGGGGGGVGSGFGDIGSSSSATTPPPRIRVRHALCRTVDPPLFASPEIPRAQIHAPEEEIAFGPAAWLWDYLRRSGAGGFLLPLSGGADSASVAAIVGAMCQMVVHAAVVQRDVRVMEDARRITGVDLSRGSDEFDVAAAAAADDGNNIDSPPPPPPFSSASVSIIDTSGNPRLAALSRSLARRLLTTVYLASAEASSPETRARAATLAEEVGSEHREAAIDGVVEALLVAARDALGPKKKEEEAAAAAPPAPRPRFAADGGSRAESLALQNVQARSRMVLAFLMAQLGPWAEEVMEEEEGEQEEQERGGSAGCGGCGAVGERRANVGAKKRHPRCFHLVLGAANVDEALRGYLTKYDCSAADLNPIGGVSKTDLRKFLRWAAEGLGYPSLVEIERAPPTAELEPTRKVKESGLSSSPPSAPVMPAQTDEADMGMTYAVSLYEFEVFEREKRRRIRKRTEKKKEIRSFSPSLETTHHHHHKKTDRSSRNSAASAPTLPAAAPSPLSKSSWGGGGICGPRRSRPGSRPSGCRTPPTGTRRRR